MFLKSDKKRRVTAEGKAFRRNGAARMVISVFLAGLLIFMPSMVSFGGAISLDKGADDVKLPGMNEDNAAYKQFTGKVTMIDVWDGKNFIRIENDEGGETDFVINDGKTVFSNLNGLTDFNAVKTGATVTVYCVMPLIMTLQYPPRFEASVVVMLSEDNPGSAFVGIVNKDGLASDGSVKLTISDETQITRQSDGGAFAGADLTNRIIIAYFAVTTRSMPPIALVQKVVVLDKLSLPVYVNGARLFGAEAIVKPDGTVMAPLRAVAEATGSTVEWDEAVKTVRIGVAIYVTIGSDEYIIGRAAPVKLETAAELIGWRTYVPLSFFETILNLKLDDSVGLISFTDK